MKQQLTSTKLFAAAMAILLLGSCNKAKVDYFDVPADTGSTKIKIIDFGTDTRTNFYDDKGRFIKATYKSGSSSALSYGTNTATFESFNPGPVLAQKDSYILNADGLLVSSTNSNNLTSTFYYTFNTDKKLVYDTYISSGVLVRERFYTYIDGNLVKDSTKEGSSWNTNTYEYFTSIASTTENANYGTEFYGSGNKNAVKKITNKNSAGVIKTRVYSTPQVDAIGRISKISFSQDGAATTTYSYTYY